MNTNKMLEQENVIFEQLDIKNLKDMKEKIVLLKKQNITFKEKNRMLKKENFYLKNSNEKYKKKYNRDISFLNKRIKKLIKQIEALATDKYALKRQLRFFEKLEINE